MQFEIKINKEKNILFLCESCESERDAQRKQLVARKGSTVLGSVDGRSGFKEHTKVVDQFSFFLFKLPVWSLQNLQQGQGV
jgi:hypothetical protein